MVTNTSNDQFVQIQQNRTHNHPNFISSQLYDDENNNDINNTSHNQQQHESEPNPDQDVTVNNDDNDYTNNDETLSSYTFVVVADTQLGMTTDDEQWDIEIANSKQAVLEINSLTPRPLFCCICGDLVNMTSSIYSGRTKPIWLQQKQQQEEASDNSSNTVKRSSDSLWTNNECDIIRTKQVQDFKQIWSQLHPEIALVCLCGNHDVGNRPTKQSIQQYQNEFGSDYLSFWLKGTSTTSRTYSNTNNDNDTKPTTTTTTDDDSSNAATRPVLIKTISPSLSTYCIVFNSSLFNDPTGYVEYYNEQLVWLESQLQYANKCCAKFIFMFCHHPLYINNENEDTTPNEDGSSSNKNNTGYYSTYRNDITISDSYFHIPKVRRQILLDLFAKYNVTATFCGHFHQSMTLTTSFGMELIITGPVSLLLASNDPQIVNHPEPKTLGYRIVTVSQTSLSSSSSSIHNDNHQQNKQATFQHKFISLGRQELQ